MAKIEKTSPPDRGTRRRVNRAAVFLEQLKRSFEIKARYDKQLYQWSPDTQKLIAISNNMWKKHCTLKKMTGLTLFRDHVNAMEVILTLKYQYGARTNYHIAYEAAKKKPVSEAVILIVKTNQYVEDPEIS